MLDKFKQTLKQAGYSVTKSRMTVFGALQGPKPKTMHELTESLNGVIDRASVYRSVNLFEKLGVVNRIQHGWKYRIELSDSFVPHHHHMTCTNCQRVISFDESAGFELMIEKIAAKNGFSMKSHNLEIYGLCAICSSKTIVRQTDS